MKEIGQKLKAAREETGLSLNEVSQMTKIRSLYLEAIEEGNMDRIPGTVYAKGFIKSYATAVGLDANEILTEYQSYLDQLPPEEPEELPEITVMKVKRPKPVGKIVVTLLIVVLLGGGFFFVKSLWSTIQNETIPQLLEPEPQNQQSTDSQSQQFTNPSVNQEQNANQNSDQSQMQIIEPNIEMNTEVTTDVSTEMNPDENSDPNVASNDEKNTPIRSDDSTVTKENNTADEILSQDQKTNIAQNTDSTDERKVPVQQTQTDAAKTIKETQEETPPHPMNQTSQVDDKQGTEVPQTREVESKTQIQVIAEGNSWIRVQVDGETAFQGQLKQGESPIFAGKKINLRIGNAEAVKVNYNGFLIGPFGGKNELVEKVFGE